MKSIIAETERDAYLQTSPKDGSPVAKWKPRTPPRPERMPPAPGSLLPPSPSKKIDLRVTPTITQGSSTTIRPDTTSSGLSITRPQGAGPALPTVKPQPRSPPRVLASRPPIHVPPPLTRTQSTQVSHPITPVKMEAGSSSIRRTSQVPSPLVTLP